MLLLGPQAKLQLDEDALVLWQALLRNASTLDPRLAALVPAAVEALANDRDMLNRTLGILDSYVLLDGPNVYEVRPPGLSPFSVILPLFFSKTHLARR
jgi:hypothetical protein